MKIKTRLRINILLPVAAFLLIAFITIENYRSETSLTLKRNTVREFSFGVFDLNLLTTDFIRNTDERTKAQWENKYIRLLEHIEGLSFDEPYRSEKLSNIKHNLEGMGELFFGLADEYGNESGLAREQTKGIEDRLIVTAGAVGTDCATLLVSMNDEIKTMGERALFLVLSATAALMLLTAGTLTIFNRRISSSLDRLKRGAEIFGAGNLDYKIGIEADDETGDLSRAFDAMTATLKETTASLAGEKERLAVTLRSIGDGVITTDLGGKIVLINKVAERLTGWTNEEAVGKPLSEVFRIVDAETRATRDNPVEKVLRNSAIIELPDRTMLLARDGAERLIADSGAPIRDKDSRDVGVVLVFRDVTEKQKMEDELLKIQKLESVGVLAGGIAHDFNNALAAILTNISVAKMSEDPEGATYKLLSSAERASLRARDLTMQLLTFSKGGAPVKKTSSLRELIAESAGFALAGSNVRCEYSIAKDLWLAEVDEGQINQVISNIVINACQAMPRGGSIRICAENAVLSDFDALPLKGGNYVMISIKDTGPGIPEEDLPRVFDPFFTTKTGGTGLGLATTYAIVKKHHGHIAVESKAGEGAAFTIYIPAGAESEKEEIACRHHQAAFAGQKPGGKVLVVDDDTSIKEALGPALLLLGYAADFADNGEEALDLYKREKEKGRPYEAVILDLTIPGGMGGKETIEQLLRIDPGVRAIVSSGYSNDPAMAEYKKYGFCAVIPKPYQVDELNRLLQKVIRGV